MTKMTIFKTFILEDFDEMICNSVLSCSISFPCKLNNPRKNRYFHAENIDLWHSAKLSEREREKEVEKEEEEEELEEE